MIRAPRFFRCPVCMIRTIGLHTARDCAEIVTERFQKRGLHGE